MDIPLYDKIYKLPFSMLDVCDAHPISGGVSEDYDVSPDG